MKAFEAREIAVTNTKTFPPILDKIREAAELGAFEIPVGYDELSSSCCDLLTALGYLVEPGYRIYWGHAVKQ